MGHAAVAVGTTVANADALAALAAQRVDENAGERERLRDGERPSAENSRDTNQRHPRHQLTENPFLENRLVGVRGVVGLCPRYSPRDAEAYSLKGELLRGVGRGGRGIAGWSAEG